MSIGLRIKERRKALGMSAEELGIRLGKNRATIYRYENGFIENLPLDMLEPIAAALETTPQYLLNWEVPVSGKTSLPAGYDNILRISTKQFPVLGNIACGEPILANNNIELYIEAGTNIQADFVLRAKGDSMIGARIQDGDFVFIRQQNSVNDGEIAAVLIGDEATLKRVYFDAVSGTLTLYAENPKYPTMRFSGEELADIRILGKAIAFQSDIR